MGKKGVKYYRRGKKSEVRVGFYFFEVVLSFLGKNPNGKTVRQVANQLKVNYHTARNIMNNLTELNRVTWEKRKIFKGPAVKHYKPTPWRLQ